MKKRLITGILYIGVIVGFFFLRNIHPWFFGILVYAFSLIGTYEMVHAFSYRKVKEDGTEEPPAFEMALSQKIAVFAFAALFTPVYYLVEWLAGEGVGYRGMLILAFVFALALLCLLVFDHKRCSLQGAGGAMLCAFYPTVLLATMLLANDLAAGTLALLIIFVISPVADTFAFVVGSILRAKNFARTSARTRRFRARWAASCSARAQACFYTGCTRCAAITYTRGWAADTHGRRG